MMPRDAGAGRIAKVDIGLHAPASTATQKSEKGAPKTDLDMVWEEHQQRRKAGIAHLSPTHEAAFLKDWLKNSQSATAIPGRKTIYNRLLSRFGAPYKKKGAGYTRNLIAYYRTHGLQDTALATYDATLDVV
ncbi:hypothetical protein AAFN86_15995 [Roseomonas sp. CAU 1739]|uniref:hypothetical protein n=1 Tax=Roseomonas sp. CAU 1739 TaxID=3140364 RepID=UPI00325A9184